MTATPFADGFYDRLRNARERAGLTQRELGAEADVNYSQISRYEHGTAFPRPGVLLRLAKATGVSPEYLRSGGVPVADEVAYYEQLRPQLPKAAVEAFEAQAVKSGMPVDALFARLEALWIKTVRDELRAMAAESERAADAAKPTPKRKR
ncbi:helix-turn-helix domain-containing protein [Xanthomonas citri]|uniref:helix-turn-helix domain-containing protein n=1 Tax=Xanthomonas citri TaxID=346 RepID=UPI0001CED395|nr:helix-turn-helix transcriptional regulator [Xanthomonas citri]EFF47355.1 transcriptional regulator [Xanthomonas citri pv. aurantifolii str. ICPB 10535]MCC8490856.1 helix-turn-helix domain-containing protein [Xanthomonas citri pv. fuscans]